MKKFAIFILASIFAAVSCEEWDPVVTCGYPAPEPAVEYDLDSLVNRTIAEVKSLYVNGPVDITEKMYIKGQVISSDASGNLYRSIYIQDASDAIELKIAKSSLYNDYKTGQWLYVNCEGLTVGAYGGMIQIGYKDEGRGKSSSAYETTYIGGQYLIDTHIIPGRHDVPREPEVLSEADLGASAEKCRYLGHYVIFKGIKYGNQVSFSIKNTSDASLSISGKPEKIGVTTYSMTKEKFKSYMTASTGKVEPQSAFGGNVTAETWKSYYDNAQAYYVTHSYKVGSKEIQVRTSGYCKFADYEIDPDAFTKSVNLSGILTRYNSSYQLTLLDKDGIEVIK